MDDEDDPLYVPDHLLSANQIKADRNFGAGP
jgi:hypothetical protein